MTNIKCHPRCTSCNTHRQGILISPTPPSLPPPSTHQHPLHSPFTHPPTHSLTHSLTHLQTCLLTHSLPSSLHPPTHLLTCSLTLSPSSSPTHLPTHSLTHSLPSSPPSLTSSWSLPRRERWLQRSQAGRCTHPPPPHPHQSPPRCTLRRSDTRVRDPTPPGQRTQE